MQNNGEKEKNGKKQGKKYPDAVVLRKGIVVGSIVLILVIFAIVFVNIYHSTHQRKAEGGERPQVVNNLGERWYNRPEIHTKAVPQRVLQKTGNKPTTTEDSPAMDNNQTAASLDELKKAMSAPISANQISQEIGKPNSEPLPSPHEIGGVPQAADDPNLQHEKKAFLRASSRVDEDYLHEPLKNPITPYELKAGTIIPAILITGINSELPGQITAQVRANVYDTVSGRYVLVPQGAKLTGLYDSQIAYGQERVLIAWKRIIFPNGQSINLEGMPGVDLSGYGGFTDVVNNHYMKIFGSVILMSAISAGAQLSQPQPKFSNNNQLSVGQMLAGSLGANIMNTANSMTQKNLSIQPTLIIRPGYIFNVSITKDMVFPGAYDDKTSYEN